MSEETQTPQNTETAGFAAGDQGSRSVMSKSEKEMVLAEGTRFKSKRRRKVSYLTINKIDTVDYKDVALLRRFLNDRGKIQPARQSGNNAKQQRMVAEAIRRAREMALLPFVVTEMNDRREAPIRRERRPEPVEVQAPEPKAESAE
jgi:small subunit ribosomal protein S18